MTFLSHPVDGDDGWPCASPQWAEHRATARNGNLLQARANNFDGLAFCQGLPCGAVFQERARACQTCPKSPVSKTRASSPSAACRACSTTMQTRVRTPREPTAQRKSDFQRIKLRQRVAVNMEGRTTRTTMVGQDVAMPVAIAPTGLTGMQHADGEILAPRPRRLAFRSRCPP